MMMNDTPNPAKLSHREYLDMRRAQRAYEEATRPHAQRLIRHYLNGLFTLDELTIALLELNFSIDPDDALDALYARQSEAETDAYYDDRN